MTRTRSIYLAMIAVLLSPMAAFADVITLEIQWDGSSFGNTATATGYFTFDDTLLPEVGDQTFFSLPDPAVLALEITISGSSGGNGTFGLADFSAYYFATPSELDLSIELIGQILSNGCAFGTSTGPCGNGLGGDFNLFGGAPGSPNGTYYFELTTSGGDSMLVTSMRSIPEPGTLALLGIGLLGMGAARRKKA